VESRVRAELSVVQIRTGAIDLSFLHNVHMVSGAHPPSYSIDTATISQGVEGPERDGNHFSASSAEVKNQWRHTSTTSIFLYGVDKDNFTFYFPLRIYKCHSIYLARCIGVVQQQDGDNLYLA
jgi:hypothetical protein